MMEQTRIHKYLAYKTASKHHDERLNKKFTRLCQKINPSQTRNGQRQENQRHVADLTNSISTEEHQLLAKGSKFSLAREINEKTSADMNIAFYRIANQIR